MGVPRRDRQSLLVRGGLGVVKDAGSERKLGKRCLELFTVRRSTIPLYCPLPNLSRKSSHIPIFRASYFLTFRLRSLGVRAPTRLIAR